MMDQRNREGGKGQFQRTDLDKKVTSKMQESQDRKAKDKKSSKPISLNNNHKDDQNNTDDMPPPFHTLVTFSKSEKVSKFNKVMMINMREEFEK